MRTIERERSATNCKGWKRDLDYWPGPATSTTFCGSPLCCSDLILGFKEKKLLISRFITLFHTTRTIHTIQNYKKINVNPQNNSNDETIKYYLLPLFLCTYYVLLCDQCNLKVHCFLKILRKVRVWYVLLFLFHFSLFFTFSPLLYLQTYSRFSSSLLTPHASRRQKGVLCDVAQQCYNTHRKPCWFINTLILLHVYFLFCSVLKSLSLLLRV